MFEAPSVVSINMEGLICRKRKYCESFIAGGKHSLLSNLWMRPMVLVALFGSRTTSKVSCGLIDVSADLGQSQSGCSSVLAGLGWGDFSPCNVSLSSRPA